MTNVTYTTHVSVEFALHTPACDYTSSLSFRFYQLHIVQEAIERVNTLVILSTDSGKTLIAVEVA